LKEKSSSRGKRNQDVISGKVYEVNVRGCEKPKGRVAQGNKSKKILRKGHPGSVELEKKDSPSPRQRGIGES